MNYDIELATSAIRGVIVPRRGHKLIVSDWASIESRIAAWACREDWKIENFRQFDAGMGADSYKGAYSRMFGIPPEEIKDDSKERQIGKVSELAFQFNGSVSALVTMCAVYNVDVMGIVKVVVMTDNWVKEKAHNILKYAKETNRLLGFSEEDYLKLAYLVSLWRKSHPKITKRWKDLQSAMEFVSSPGVEERKEYNFDGVIVSRIDEFSCINLPSGRKLMYYKMHVKNKTLIFFDPRKGWVYTYGGKLFENFVQATNVEILKPSVLRLPMVGIHPVLTTYDEIVAETKEANGVNILVEEMCRGESWCEGLPLAAKGFECERYRK